MDELSDEQHKFCDAETASLSGAFADGGMDAAEQMVKRGVPVTIASGIVIEALMMAAATGLAAQIETFGSNPAVAIPAIERFAQLVGEYTGGTIVTESVNIDDETKH